MPNMIFLSMMTRLDSRSNFVYAYSHGVCSLVLNLATCVMLAIKGVSILGTCIE